MAQTADAQEKLTVQVLQRTLGQSQHLSPQERRNIEDDIAWLNATASGTRLPAPNPKDPQRYLLVFSDEEQVEHGLLDCAQHDHGRVQRHGSHGAWREALRQKRAGSAFAKQGGCEDAACE